MRLLTPTRLLLAALMLGAGWACSDTLVSIILVDRVELEPPSLSIFIDESHQLEAHARDAAGNKLFRQSPDWSSDALDIATVDGSGLVRGISHGVTTISATVEGVRGSASVTVLRRPELEVDPVAAHLVVVIGEDGDTAVVSVIIRNLGDGELADLAAVVEYDGDASGWLDAVVEGDTALVLTARGGDLERGDYEAVISLSASNAINSPLAIPVLLDVIRNNPAPSLGGVSPDVAQREVTLDVELTGGAFLDGLTTADFGPSIMVNSVTVTAAERLVANITVERDAALGPRDVAVTNPAPGGGTAVLADAFTVEGENPFPTLQAVEPSSAHREATLDVTLEGSGFLDGITTVDFGPAITVTGVNVTAATSLVVSITIGADAAAGARDVRVANPAPGGGIATRPDAFTVLGTNPEPALTGVAPNSSMRQRTVDVALTGANFSAGYTTVDLGPGIVVNGTTVTSTTSLDANITIQSDAALGPRAVQVINAPPGGGTATLDDAFTIVLGDVSATESSVTAAPDTVVADGVDSATITVDVRDENGDAIGDLADAFDIDAGSSVEVSSVVETPTRGTYMFSIRSTLAQAATLVVAVNGVMLAERPAVEFVAGLTASVNSSLSVSNSTPLANGMAAAGVTVTLADQFDNPVTGLTDVDFVIDLGATSAVASAVTEQGDGVYTFDVTNEVAEDVTVTVTVTGVTLLQTPTISFVAGAVSGSLSTVAANPATGVTADGVDSSTVTVTVVDGNGNPIDDLTDADFVINASGATAGTVSPTAASGEYEFKVTSTDAGTFAIVVTVSGVELDQKPTVEFVPGDVSASVSDVAADPATGVVADGLTASTVTILLRDAQGNAIPNLASGAFLVQVTGAGQASTVSETATAGTYEFTVTNTTAETVTVTVTADGILLDDQPQIEFVPDDVSATLSTAVADPDTIIAGNSSTVTVTLLDAQENLVSGQAGTFEIVFTTGTATAGMVTETGTGVYEFTVSSETAGTVTVQITAGGVTLAQTPTIEVEAGTVSAANSNVTAPSTAEVETTTTTSGEVAGSSQN